MIPGANNQGLFLYGHDVTAFNKYINFQAVSLGPILTAVLAEGNYTATEFMAAIKSAMEIADPAHTYTLTLNRTVSGGQSNRMTITTSGSFLSLLFGTGVNAASSPAFLMGFTATDRTGFTTYTGVNQSGIILIPAFPTWNYLGPDEMVDQDGVKNVTANGIKETLVFAEMPFLQGEWRYITDIDGSQQKTQWVAFLKYATQQLRLEFQPSIVENPSLFYQVTLESTPADSNGMKYKLEQMTQAGLFRQYQTGLMKFRLIPEGG